MLQEALKFTQEDDIWSHQSKFMASDRYELCQKILKFFQSKIECKSINGLFALISDTLKNNTILDYNKIRFVQKPKKFHSCSIQERLERGDSKMHNIDLIHYLMEELIFFNDKFTRLKEI